MDDGQVVVVGRGDTRESPRNSKKLQERSRDTEAMGFGRLAPHAFRLVGWWTRAWTKKVGEGGCAWV